MRSLSNALRCLAALFLVVAGASAQDSWVRQSPWPYPVDARSTVAFGGSRAYLVGGGTSVLESLDGGWSWTPRPMGAGSFNAITFFGPNHGWIVGNHGGPGNHAFRTVDGGVTWIPMSTAPAGSYYKVQFVSTTRGWMGGNGVLASTTDGGANWSIVTLPSPQFSARFDFFDASLGLVSTGGDVYRTTDGGATWTPVTSAWADSLDFVDANTVLLGRDTSVAPAPDFARSTDGGLTWTDVDVPGVHLWKPVKVPGGALIAASGGWARSDLYRSIDAGLTWTFVHQGDWYPFNRGAFRDSLYGFFFMNGGHIVRTQDGGETWTQASSGFVTQFEDVEMLDDSRGVACGYDGTLLTTSNGGTTWSPSRAGFSLSAGGTLRAISTAPPSFVFAAGENGTHVKSLDAGRTWIGVTAPGDSWACDFLSPDEGWIAGGSRRIYHTTDGGSSWTLQHAVIGSSEAIYDIEFVDALHGWAVGTFHGVMLTTDGGATWTLNDYGVAFPFGRQVDMVDASIGWLSSRADFIARTTNGGATWTQQPIPPAPGGAEQYVFSLGAISATECWAATQQGRVYRTTNAGATWSYVETGFHDLYDNWYGLSARADGNVWLCGGNGSIVRRLGTPLEAGESFCFGDASGSACPCGNDAAPGTLGGCTNSLGRSGTLLANGIARLSADTVVLAASALPATGAVLFLQGTAAENGGAGTVLGDGLLCVAGTMVRLGTRTSAGGSVNFPASGEPSVSVRGAPGVGATRTYQAWYRNAASYCTPNTFNLTNASRITWAP